MPVVPFNNVQPFEPQRPQMPDEPWALMAAAQMHFEGRLVQQVADDSTAAYPIHIDDIMDSYYKGTATAAQTQSALKSHGWGANLRSPNSVQIWGPDGKVMWHP